MNNWPHQYKVQQFYGDPQENGHENSAWVVENIVRISAPWRLVTAWDFKPVSAIRVHKKCADSLQRILNDIWEQSGKSQDVINEWGMNLYGGAYHFRLMRGKTKLSMHSYGCAIDFDPSRNSFGNRNSHFKFIPPVLNAFEKEGWVWGGNWSKPDGMHWQAATI